MFREVEDAWTRGSGGYDGLVRRQFSNRQDVECWKYGYQSRKFRRIARK